MCWKPQTFEADRARYLNRCSVWTNTRFYWRQNQSENLNPPLERTCEVTPTLVSKSSVPCLHVNCVQSQGSSDMEHQKSRFCGMPFFLANETSPARSSFGTSSHQDRINTANSVQRRASSQAVFTVRCVSCNGMWHTTKSHQPGSFGISHCSLNVTL